MIRRPPRSTRTDTLFPYTTLFRSRSAAAAANRGHRTESNITLHPPFVMTCPGPTWSYGMLIGLYDKNSSRATAWGERGGRHAPTGVHMLGFFRTRRRRFLPSIAPPPELGRPRCRAKVGQDVSNTV